MRLGGIRARHTFFFSVRDQGLFEMKYSDKSLAVFRQVVDKVELDRDLGTVSAEFCCPADFPAFTGHFPGQPVLPAVMQLVFVRMLAGDLLQTELDPVRTGRMKFKGMIKPDEIINIQVSLEKSDEQWHVAFKLKKLQSVVSSGTVLFKAAAR